MTTTISAIGAGAGSFPGSSQVHPRVLEEAAKRLREQEGGLLTDSFVTRCGDGLGLVTIHARGVGDEEICCLIGDVLRSCAGVATGLKLHGTCREPLPGEVKGLAELEFEERGSEPVLVFMAAAARAGAWNLPLYKTFADPFTTPGLVSEPSMHDGFVFEIHDLAGCRRSFFRTPEESYDLLACIGTPSRFVVRRVFSTQGAIAASTSLRWPDADGGWDRPVMVVRSESEFPAVGECLAPFATPFLVAGGLRGAHHAPLVPVAACDAGSTVADGPPRATCLGFQVCNGRLLGPADMFDDPAFDPVRRTCLELAERLRGTGPFEPHRLPLARTEDAAPSGVEQPPAGRWEPLA
jgi:fructose 1,6-bisphosphate aldolase/phosphatase